MMVTCRLMRPRCWAMASQHGRVQQATVTGRAVAAPVRRYSVPPHGGDAHLQRVGIVARPEAQLHPPCRAAPHP